jgi:hypothetical protein
MLTSAKEFFVPGEQRRRLLMTFVGIVVCAISGGIMKRAGFGGDPFQMFTNGLDNVLPLDFGTIHLIISVIMLSVIFRLDKHFIGVATVFNLFLTGYIVDFTYRGLGILFPAPGMALRIEDGFAPSIVEGDAYELRVYTDKGLAYASQFDPTKPQALSLEVQKRRYYRAEIFDLTHGYRVAVSNPIWLDAE